MTDHPNLKPEDRALIELKPCPNPWCTSTTTPLPAGLKETGWRVMCGCGVQTFRTETCEEAKNAWNTRPQEGRCSPGGGVELRVDTPAPLPSGGREAWAQAIGGTPVNMNMDIASIIAQASPSADVREVLCDAADAILALIPTRDEAAATGWESLPKFMAGSGDEAALPEPVGEAGSMPGSSGFTMAAFKASDVPIGAKLYAAPQAPAAELPGLLVQSRRMLVLASYCGDDNAACSDEHPCPDCLAMDNVALVDGRIEIIGEFGEFADRVPLDNEGAGR